MKKEIEQFKSFGGKEVERVVPKIIRQAIKD